MLASFRLLLKPLRYLAIAHEVKTWVDLWIPVILGVLSVGAIVWIDLTSQVLSDSGFVAGINELLQILAGFYIAALAAVATFNLGDLDNKMEGKAPTIVDTVDGEKVTVALTRRQFLCAMFGYLAWMSIVLFLIGLTFRALASAAISVPRPVANVALSFYSIAVWNLLTTTALGLYYLSDRIYRSTPVDMGPAAADETAGGDDDH